MSDHKGWFLRRRTGKASGSVRVLRRRGARGGSNGCRRLKPALVALEERRLLSTYTVNTTNDENSTNAVPGDLSLRMAIIQANANPGADTIMVPAGTYRLTITGTGEDAGQTGD